MGTDICMVLEECWRPAGWEPAIAGPLPIQRNYRLFAILADVENYSDKPEEPIAAPRGWPDDISKETHALLHNKYGDHGRSWLTIPELESRRSDIERVAPKFMRLIDALVDSTQYYLQDGERRLVFNFF